jgi:DHA1 family tetracycline resistance protein-like MFS transporter
MKTRSPLLPIFLIVLVDVFGFTLVIPLLAIYAESYGASPLVATLLVSSYALCQLVSGPLLGRASDRVGRKPMLLVSQVGTLLGFLLMARANALWMIFAARILDGLTAGNLSLAQAYISDHTAREERSKAFAMIGIAFGVGFFLGPGLTSFLVGYGLAAPIYAAACMSFASILCTLFLLPGGPAPGARQAAAKPASSIFGYLARPVLGGLMAQFFAFSVAFSCFVAGFPLFAERRFEWGGHPFGPREIGYLFAFSGFLGIVIQGGVFGRLVQRFGEGALVRAGFFLMALAYGILGPLAALPPLFLVQAFGSTGNALLRPTLSSLISQSAGPEEQGAVLGVSQAIMSIGQIAAPPLAGFLIGRGALLEWAWFCGAAAIAGIALAPWGSSKAIPRGMKRHAS